LIFKKQNKLSTSFDMYHVINWELDFFGEMKCERVYEYSINVWRYSK